MSAKPTPGPWTVEPKRHNGQKIEIPAIGVVSEGWTVALAWDDLDPGEGSANARLIAAAPDMLDALLACVEPLEEGGDCPLPPDLYNLVCAAIAKATGAQS